MQRLVSLAEEKMASLGQATQNEYGQQMGEAFQEQTQAMREAADRAVKSIKQAAQEAIAQLQAAEQMRESSLVRADATEERLRGVSSAVESLKGRVGALADFIQRKDAHRAGELEGIAQEWRAQWSQQFQKQAEASMESLREEMKNFGRVAEESKQQLASLAEAKLASISQVAAKTAASLEAVQRQLKNQCENSREEPENLVTRRSSKPSSSSGEHGSPPKRRGIVATLALAAALLLVVTVPPLGVYLSAPPPVQLHLQAEAPAGFADQSPYWSAKHRAREEAMARAYWRAAVVSLEGKYPFGSELPTEPPTEFQVGKEYAPPGDTKAFSETRDHYWQKLRKTWAQRESWVESPKGNEQWTARLRRTWDQLHLSR